MASSDIPPPPPPPALDIPPPPPAAASPSPSASASPAAMNPNMRRMMSTSNTSKPAAAAAAAAAAVVAESPKPEKKKEPSPTAAAGAAAAAAKPAKARFLNVHFEYNTADPEFFPRYRELEKLLTAEFKERIKVTGEPAGVTFAIFLNKQLLFSKKQAKAFPNDRSLVHVLTHYLETGDRKEVLPAEGAGCVIA